MFKCSKSQVLRGEERILDMLNIWTMHLRRKLEIRTQDSEIQICTGNIDIVVKGMIVEVTGYRLSTPEYCRVSEKEL
jgi:hypothetical protein